MFGKPASQVSRVFLEGFLKVLNCGAKRPPSSHERERMSGTVSRVGCAHSDPLAVLTLPARPVLCAQAVHFRFTLGSSTYSLGCPVGQKNHPVFRSTFQKASANLSVCGGLVS